MVAFSLPKIKLPTFYEREQIAWDVSLEQRKKLFAIETRKSIKCCAVIVFQLAFTKF